MSNTVKARIAKWNTDTRFNFGSPVFTDTEVIGVDAAASIQLVKFPDNDDDVPFTTPGNYTFNGAEIEVIGGVAKLVQSSGLTQDYPFTTSGNYTFDSDKITIAGGNAELKGVLIAPYAWWHLNESTGTNAADSSGNGRNGTLINMENADWVAAKLNNGLIFDGANEYVNIGDVAAFERTDSFSVECWFKTTKTDFRILVARLQNVSPFRGWQLAKKNDSGRILVELINNNSGGNKISVENTTELNDGNFHHVIFTYDGSSTAAGVLIYIDGSLATMDASFDALTDTIVPSGVDLNLAARDDGGGSLDGTLDEVVIYEEVLSATDVTARYNTGGGTEIMPGSFPTDDPTVVNNTGKVFTSAIIDFAEVSTIPANTGIRYHVSSDDGVTWEYWTGSAWAVTDDTFVQANTAADIDANISTLAVSGTFKFRALLHSDTGVSTPILDNLYIAGALTYAIGDFIIEMNTDIDPVTILEWLLITETVTKPANTDIKYKYSENSGSTYNGSWLTAAALQTALQAIAIPDKIRFKFQLSNTDINATPEIDNLNITSLTGYEASGTYESTAYMPDTSISLQTISFNVVTPSGTTVLIEVQACDNTLEDTWDVYNTNENIRAAGDFIKWRVTMTGDGTNTPVLDDLQIVFYALSALRAWFHV